MTAQVTATAPATTANLGPGFDTLGLALDLWNEARFQRAKSGVRVHIKGFGAGSLPEDGGNLIAQAALLIFDKAGIEISGLDIHSHNRFPTQSGLGSSASAIVLGLVGGNALAGLPFSQAQILELAIELEKHPDNVTAAVIGGLTVSAPTAVGFQYRQIPLAKWHYGIMVPSVQLTTAKARAGLPAQVPLRKAVGSIGRTALVVEALRSGDQDLLGSVMHDDLHQPHRLKFIPGGSEALAAARSAGAAAALSGSGPGLIAIAKQVDTVERAVEDMAMACRQAGLTAWTHCGSFSKKRAEVLP